MGNYMSCSYIHPKLKSPKSARVVLPSGEVRQFRGPTNAAEVMLECPGHFLLNINSLTIGRRFSPLSADEDLEFGHLYATMPMRRVNSVVTAGDVAGFFMSAANSAPKRISSSAPPEEVGGSVAAELDGGEESKERSRLGLDYGDETFKYRLSVCRSRRPGLDTIVEEPVFAR